MLNLWTNRLTTAELQSFLNSIDKPCRGKCHQGWFHVCYDVMDGSWTVYRLPCLCTFPSGKTLTDLLNPQLYANLQTVYQTNDPAPYVLIHPRLANLFLPKPHFCHTNPETTDHPLPASPDADDLPF